MDQMQRKNICSSVEEGLWLDTPVRGHRAPTSHREFAQSSPIEVTRVGHFDLKRQLLKSSKETKQFWKAHVKAPGSEV